MRFLICLFLACISLQAQWTFTKVYGITQDSEGIVNVQEYESLSGAVESTTFTLDNQQKCLPTFIQVDIKFDAQGQFVSTEPFAIPSFNRVIIEPKLTKMDFGYAFYNVETQELEVYKSPEELQDRVLNLFLTKPCNQLMSRVATLGGVNATSDWFVVGLSKYINVIFENRNND